MTKMYTLENFNVQKCPSYASSRPKICSIMPHMQVTCLKTRVTWYAPCNACDVVRVLHRPENCIGEIILDNRSERVVSGAGYVVLTK